MKTKPRAALYCRVSTRKQKEEGTSLESQQQECERLAHEEGCTVTMLECEDITGTRLDR